MPPHTPARPRLRRGFTRLELAIVLLVVIAAGCLLLPALNRARENARARACGDNLRRLYQAMEAYHQTNNGRWQALMAPTRERQRSIWPLELQPHLDDSWAEKGSDPLNAPRPISLTCPSHPQAHQRGSSSHCLYVLVFEYVKENEEDEDESFRWAFRDRQRDLPPAKPKETWCVGLMIPRAESDEQVDRQMGPHANGVFQHWSMATQNRWKNDMMRVRAERLAPSL